MKTWKIEMAVVALLLAAAFVAGKGVWWIEALGSLAVLAAFGNAQVTCRMAEKEGEKAEPAVGCHDWALRYLITKEILFLAYFAALKSWSALVGVAVFLAYPVWRAWWRRRRQGGETPFAFRPYVVVGMRQFWLIGDPDVGTTASSWHGELWVDAGPESIGSLHAAHGSGEPVDVFIATYSSLICHGRARVRVKTVELERQRLAAMLVLSGEGELAMEAA